MYFFILKCIILFSFHFISYHRQKCDKIYVDDCKTKRQEVHMKRIQLSGNIQKKIIFVTLSCILCMCLLVSGASYYIFHNYLLRSMIHSTETNLQLLSDTIDNSLNDVYRMVLFCQTNSDIASYIKNDTPPHFTYCG